MDDSVIICDEVIDADAKLSLKESKLRLKDNNNEDEIKTIPTNFNEKKVTCKTQKFLYFTCLFINYHYIINSCQYILLPDKIAKQKHCHYTTKIKTSLY